MANAGTAWITYLGDYSKMAVGSERAISTMAGRWKAMSKRYLGPALAIGVGVGLTKLGGDFQKAYARIRTGTGQTGKALQGLRDDFKAVLATRPDSMNDVADAITNVHQRLDLTGKPLQDVTRDFLRLSKITGTKVADNVEVVGRVLGDWGVPAAQATDAMNKLFRASQVTGVSVGDTAQLMTRYGAPLRQLGFSFDESAAMVAKFEKQGVNTQLVLGSMRVALGRMAKEGEAPVETFRRVTSEIENAGSAGEANQKALELFGARAGPDMAAAIREGRFELDDMVKTIANGRDTIERSATDTATFSGKWKTFTNALRVGIEPVAIRFFDGLTAAMATVQPWLLKIADAFAYLTSNTDLLVVSLSALAGFLVAGKIVGAIQGIQAAFGAGTLISGGWIILAITALAALAAGLVIAYNKVKWFHDAVDAVWQGLVATFHFVARNWKAFVAGLAIGLTGPLAAIVAGFAYLYSRFEWFRDAVQAVVGGIGKAVLEYMVEPIRTAVRIITKLIHGDWRGALGELVGLPMRMLRLFGRVWGELGKLVAGALAGAVRAIAAFVPKAAAAMGRFGVNLVAAIVQAIPKVLAALGRLGLAIVTWAIAQVPKLGAAFLRWVPKLLGWAVELAIKVPLFLAAVWIKLHYWVVSTGVRMAAALAAWVPKALAWVIDLARRLPGMLLRAWVAINLWIGRTAIRIGIAAAKFVPKALAWVGDVLRKLPGQLAKIGTLIWDALTQLPGLIAKAGAGIFRAFTNIGKGIFGAIKDGIVAAAKGVGGFAASMGKALWGWIKDHVFTPLVDWEMPIPGHPKPFKKLLSVIGMAAGGMVGRPTLALIGEAGPELVLPLNDPKRVAELLAAYAPGLITHAQGGAAAGGTPTEPTGINTWADSVVARMALLPAQIMAATAPLTEWRRWMLVLFAQVAAAINRFAVTTRVRLATWAAREVPAATLPALTVWQVRVVGVFRTMVAQVSAVLRAAVASWRSLGTQAGNAYVRALTSPLRSATSSITRIVDGYAKALAKGLNPVLKAVGQKPIRLAQGGVVNYARGGVAERHVAQVAPAGAYRVWAEPETGGEAYIPLAAGKRSRSKAITEAVVRRFGGAVTWYRGGGVTGDTAGLHPVFLQRLNAWSQAVGEPYHVGSGYRSIASQANLYARWLAHVPGQAQAAKPGSSMHNYGLASDGSHWSRRNPGAFSLRYPMSYEPWHVEPNEARQWRGMTPAAGWGDSPGVPRASLPAVPTMPHAGLLYDVADKAMKYTLAKATAWAANALASASYGAPAPVAGAALKGSAVEVGKAMAAARGWVGSQWDALYQLWMKESGWRVNADNPTSSAYGIPQALPGSKMSSFGADWRTNPHTQIGWGLNYIAQRYGSPRAAWAHSQAHNWYSHGGLVFMHARSFDNGGTLAPGLNLVHNGTGSPEALARRGTGAAVQIGTAHFHEPVDLDLLLRKTAFLVAAGRV